MRGGRRSPSATLNKRSLWESLISTKIRDHTSVPCPPIQPEVPHAVAAHRPELAAQVRADGCRCGGALHRADYPRKPRGCPVDVRPDFLSRLSFCCALCRRRSTSTSRCALATTMPTTTEVTDMVLRSLACECALGRAGARNRSGFRKTSTATVRHVLRDGLQSPSAYQAARNGLAASTAVKLYRAWSGLKHTSAGAFESQHGSTCVLPVFAVETRHLKSSMYR